MRERTTIQLVRHAYTDDERLEMSEDMAEIVAKITDLEEEKSSISSDFNSKIKDRKGKLNDLSRKVREGYEMVELECRVEWDMDAGIRRVYHPGTGRLLDERRMTEEELQNTLPGLETDEDEEHEAGHETEAAEPEMAEEEA